MRTTLSLVSGAALPSKPGLGAQSVAVCSICSNGCSNGATSSEQPGHCTDKQGPYAGSTPEGSTAKQEEAGTGAVAEQRPRLGQKQQMGLLEFLNPARGQGSNVRNGQVDSENGYMIFIKANGPDSIIPGLYQAGLEWKKKKKEENPSSLKLPLRAILFQLMIQELIYRLKKLDDPEMLKKAVDAKLCCEQLVNITLS